MGASRKWGAGSKSSLSGLQLPPAAGTAAALGQASGDGSAEPRGSNQSEEDADEPAGSLAKKGGSNSPTSAGADNKRRGSGGGYFGFCSPTAKATEGSHFQPDSDAAQAEQGGAAEGGASRPRSSSRTCSSDSGKGASAFGLLSRAAYGGSGKIDTAEVVTAEPPAPLKAMDPLEELGPMLAKFAERHGLNPEAAEELNSIFVDTANKYKEIEQGPTYRWDQIHEIIVAHSPNTSLVIVNLPDPPELAAQANLNQEQQMQELLDYMNYMEGVALNLPRVLYVHGSGQEVINFDKME